MVTHPNCLSNVFKPLDTIFKEHEHLKKKEYEQRVLQTEKGSFVPLVFSTLGGMGPACESLNKRLARMISEKKNELYAHTIGHIRTRLRFSLLRGTLASLTGDRGKPRAKGDDNLYNISLNLIPNIRSYEEP